MAAALGLGLTFAGPWSAAAEPLSTDAVRQEIARRVPPSWQVGAVTLEPAESGRAAPGPVRLSARVALAKPTFLVDGREGPYTFVRPAAEAGLEKVLTGTATFGKAKDGTVTAKVEFDNADILDSLGKPAEELPGRPVVAGSEEAQRARAALESETKQRVADEQARRQREEDLLVEQQATAQTVEARIALMNEVRARLTSTDRATRIATYEAVLGGDDLALRQIAVEAALQSRDAVLANLALKDWISRHKTIPVLLYATKEDPNSETVLRNLGPLSIEVDSFTGVNGTLQGKMGAAGYSVVMPAAATGTLAQTELTVNTQGCTLTLRLTEHRTLDGLYRCQTLPTLVARVTVD